MSVIQLKGSRRESVGKGGARKARAAGLIPGVIYGHGETPVPVAVDAREFEIALRGHKGGNAIVNLAVSGAHEVTALVRDVQYDPLSRAIVHLDFQHISLTETIEVEVPVRFVGLPIGVKDGGGILEHLTRTIEVRCLPTAIPPGVDLDVTGMNVGDSLHVRDIVATGFTIITEPDVTIAAVVAPAVEEVAPVAAEVAPATAEPEVVGAKGKKDAEGAPVEAAKEDKDKDKDKKKEKK